MSSVGSSSGARVASYAARLSASRSTSAASLRVRNRRSVGSRSAIAAFHAARISSVGGVGLDAEQVVPGRGHGVAPSVGLGSGRLRVPPVPPSSVPVSGLKSSTSQVPFTLTSVTWTRNGAGSVSTRSSEPGLFG